MDIRGNTYLLQILQLFVEYVKKIGKNLREKEEIYRLSAKR